MQRTRSIYIAILAPVLLIITAAFFSSWNLKNIYPNQDFIYTVANNYFCAEKIKAQLFPELQKTHLLNFYQQTNCGEPQLYVYHFKNRTSTPLTFSQAQHLALSSQLTSNEGYRISPTSDFDRFFLWMPNSFTYNNDFLVINKDYQRHLNIPPVENNAHSFYLQFIAWMPGDRS